MNPNIFKKILGAVLILLGLAALITPLTPGGWLIFIGGELLGLHILSRERLREYYRRVRAVVYR